MEYIGLINSKKIKKEVNISKKNIIDNNKNKVNEKFNNMDISSEKVLDNKIIGEHEDNKLKENEYDNIQEDIKNNSNKQTDSKILKEKKLDKDIHKLLDKLIYTRK